MQILKYKFSYLLSTRKGEKLLYFLIIFHYHFIIILFAEKISEYSYKNGKNEVLSPRHSNKSLPLSKSLSFVYPSSTSSYLTRICCRNSPFPFPPSPLVLPCTTTPAVKSVPSAPPPLIPPPQIVVTPPRKKVTYPGPFIKGQVGTVFFSMDKVQSYMEILHGYSIIVQNF